MPAKKKVRGLKSARVAAQAIVQHHDMQNIEQLAFVFVNTLDLAIEDRIGIDDLARRGSEASP